MEYLIKKRLLQPMLPRPLPYPLPHFYNTRQHCEYHQTPGHTLDKCFRLKHDIQDLIDEGKVSFNPTPTNPPPNTNIIQNPLLDHKPSKGVNMIGTTGIQFNLANYITKASEPKKVIFLPDINHISTIGRHAPKPVPTLEYEHLLAHMWDMAPKIPISILPTDINIYREGSATYDPFTSPHIIPPPSLYTQLTDHSSPCQIINIPPPTRIQYLLNRVPLGYLVGEVADPELSKDELKELTAFITRSGRVSKPVTYLHPEGKGKEKMVEEETETKVQK